MQRAHQRRRRSNWRPLSTPAIVKIASLAEHELDRASLERIGMLFLDHSPAAQLAAAWEAQALSERCESGLVPTPDHTACRCPR